MPHATSRRTAPEDSPSALLHVDVSSHRLELEFGGRAAALVLVEDVAARLALGDQLDYSARYDPLTNLPTRGPAWDPRGRGAGAGRRGVVAVLVVAVDNIDWMASHGERMMLDMPGVEGSGCVGRIPRGGGDPKVVAGPLHAREDKLARGQPLAQRNREEAIEAANRAFADGQEISSEGAQLDGRPRRRL